MVKAHRRAAAVAVLTALALVGTGCTAAGGTSSGAGNDTVRTTLTTDPTTFDPAKANAKDDYQVARYLFDTVVRLGEDGELVGGIASKWESDADQAVLTLRDDATCSDGTTITPAIVADSLNYFADPETRNNFAKLVFGPGTPEIQANDDAGTVTIDLAQPWSEVLRGLTLAQTGIICPAGLDDLDGLAKGSVDGAFSGPYSLTSASHGVKYEMTLRDEYDAWPEFGAAIEGTPPSKIIFRPGVDKTTVANQLLTGEVDVAEIAPADLERFEGDDNFDITTVPFAGIWLLFNQREGSPFVDPELRHAVAQALSAKAFNDAAYAGQGIPYNTIVAPNVPCALPDDSHVTPVDLDAARKVLEGKTFKMVGTTSIGPNGAGNTYVQEALRAVGAEVELDLVDNGTWATKTQTQPDTWDMTVQGDANFVGTVAASLTRIAGVPTEDGGRNIGGAANESVLDDIKTAQAASDDADRCAAYEHAQATIMDKNDIVPFVAEPQIVVQRSGYSVADLGGIIDYATTRIEG
ncbi:ABC transporter substrate-binding protein [Paramicrobacterium chengjingii]|uniref:ABC transporter substrate-binding protein n=1 Tax=Paramicrobacterium chengjingii TaxID=2769067 RepID=A0ABX6YH97_9MICO|nr:ABC transporter substrate-binding protein [Microbacterium chengjingii]QPZ38167.1 ABC transporter substrate-binding protein [Microbacterium chengjingii]